VTYESVRLLAQDDRFRRLITTPLALEVAINVLGYREAELAQESSALATPDTFMAHIVAKYIHSLIERRAGPRGED